MDWLKVSLRGSPTTLWELLCWEPFLCLISIICCFFLPIGSKYCEFYINNFPNFLCGVATDILSVKTLYWCFPISEYIHTQFFFLCFIFFTVVQLVALAFSPLFTLTPFSHSHSQSPPIVCAHESSVHMVIDTLM